MAVRQAEALIQRGDLQRAEALLRQELQAHEDVAALYVLGFVLIQRYRYAEAESYLRQAVSQAPGDAAYRHALAKSLVEQGKNLAAIEELNRAIALGSKPEYHYAKAMCALNLGRLDLAEAALRSSLELRPEQPEALYELGRIEIDRGDYAAGIVPLSRSIELNPAQAEARFLLGLAHRHEGDLEAAATAFEAVLERVPGHVGALFNLTSVRSRQGRTEEAESWRERFETATARQDEIEFLKVGIRKNPANAAGRLRLAQLLLDGGHGEQALAALLAARRLAPADPAIYRLMARLFALRGDEARARQASQVAAELEGGQ